MSCRREDVLEVLLRHRAVHVYGLADVAQLWPRSRWYRRGTAVVGIVEVPGAQHPVVYAIAAGPASAALWLLGEIAPRLPPRIVLHGAVGATDRLVHAGFRPLWRSRHVKMHLADPGSLPAPDGRVQQLGRGDLPALEALYAMDEHAGAVFHADLLDTGRYVGLTADGVLVTAAGVHVVCPGHGVAAIANVATHPDFRRRGAARAVLATLCHRLLDEVDVIGLNVGEDNRAAAGLYRAVGFRRVVTYEEAELAIG